MKMAEMHTEIDRLLKLKQRGTIQDIEKFIIDVYKEMQEDVDHSSICAITAETKWNAKFRFALANIVVNHFRCRQELCKGKIVLIGHYDDVRIAVTVFNFLYKYVMQQGNHAYNQAYAFGKNTVGTFNCIASMCLVYIESSLDKNTQCDMSAPEDVKSCKSYTCI